MADLAWTTAAIALLGGLAYALWRIEPHWVSRDGRRFTCNVQHLDAAGNVHGRWREHRAEIDGEGRVVLRRRLTFGPDRPGAWEVTARAPSPPRGKAVFLLRALDPDDSSLRAVRVPASSAAADELDALVAPSPGR